MNYKSKVIFSQRDLTTSIKNDNYLVVKAKYGPSRLTKIPLAISEELAFFVAAIIGDGHLSGHKLQIIFARKFNIKPIKLRENRLPTFCLYIDSKAIFNLLNQVFDVKRGKKSDVVKILEFIAKSNVCIKKAFVMGILATEGGRRKRGIGMSSASFYLWKDIIFLLDNLGIKVLSDKWKNKKYNKEYYGISFRKDYISLITRGCQSGQMDQFLRKYI